MTLAANVGGQVFIAVFVSGLLAFTALILWLERRRILLLRELFENAGFQFTRRPSSLAQSTAAAVLDPPQRGWYRLRTGWLASGAELDRSVDVVEQVRPGKNGYSRTRIAVSCRPDTPVLVSPAAWLSRSKHGVPFLPEGEPLGGGWFLVRGDRAESEHLLNATLHAARLDLGRYVSVNIGDGCVATCRLGAARAAVIRQWISETIMLAQAIDAESTTTLGTKTGPLGPVDCRS